MPWTAAAIVGGAIIGGAASQDAASTQADAANHASDLTQQQYQQTREDLAPWRQAGQNALGQISDMNGYFNHQFNTSDLRSNLAPNYDFQLQQGLGATRNFANSTGGLISGNTLKGINDYAQNFAANSYQQAFNNYTAQQTNIFNRLADIAGLGQTANQTSAVAGSQAAGNMGNFLTSGAAAQAAGQVGTANAINSGINNYLGWNYLNSGGANDFSRSQGNGGVYGLPSYAIDPYGPGG